MSFCALTEGILRQNLEKFLSALEAPCYESELLAQCFPDFNILSASPLALYQHHFALFHVLYELQEKFQAEGKYLFIHFMRTFLIEYPEQGNCRFYLPEMGSFCQSPLESSDSRGKWQVCVAHRRFVGEQDLDFLSDRYFYLDSKNFSLLTEETAEQFIQGAWELLNHHTQYQRAFQTLGLAETSDLSIIRNRFRQLARECHPDLLPPSDLPHTPGTSSHLHFCEINNAYHLLMRIIPPLLQRGKK